MGVRCTLKKNSGTFLNCCITFIVNARNTSWHCCFCCALEGCMEYIFLCYSGSSLQMSIQNNLKVIFSTEGKYNIIIIIIYIILVIIIIIIMIMIIINYYNKTIF